MQAVRKIKNISSAAANASSEPLCSVHNLLCAEAGSGPSCPSWQAACECPDGQCTRHSDNPALRSCQLLERPGVKPSSAETEPLAFTGGNRCRLVNEAHRTSPPKATAVAFVSASSAAFAQQYGSRRGVGRRLPTCMQHTCL